MRLISLTFGKFAMVDDEDFAALNQFRWRALECRGRFYAVRSVTVNGKKITLYMHRVVMPVDAKCLDHEGNDSLNNQKANLRPCNHIQNGRNRRVQKHSSRFKGVSFYKLSGKWTAGFKPAGKDVHLGYFDSELEASKAYDAAVLKHYGSFARTNQQMGVL